MSTDTVGGDSPTPTSLTPTSPTSASPAPVSSDVTSAAPKQLGWQPLVRRLHFYAGILIAPFLVVAAVTGGLYAVAPTLERIIYSDLLTTDSTGPERSLAAQVAAATALRPDLTLDAVRPADKPGDTTRVLFADPSLESSYRHAVFVDPVTAETVGESVSYGSGAALPVRTWIGDLHKNLHLGEPGRLYSELAASWLWVVVLGGVALWVVRVRKQRSAHLLTVDRSSKGRNRTLNWHGAVGIWIAAGALLLSATGMTWSAYAGQNIADMRTALSWTTPSVDTDLTGTAAESGGGDHSHHGGNDAAPPTDEAAAISTANIGQLDAVLSIARGVDVGDAVEITIPSEEGSAFTVTETLQAWQVSPNSVAISAVSGAPMVADSLYFNDWNFAAKLTNWTIALHMGLLFGVANQIVLLLLMIGLLSVILRGYRMWWQRRPRRSAPAAVGTRLVGKPPRRGSLRRQPVAAIAAVLAVSVVIGWFVPLLGVSLAVFVVADTVIDWWKSR